MQDLSTAGAAPAQPAASESQSAAHAAVASGSVTDYRAARRAERAGKPLPEVAVAPVSPAPAPASDGTPVAPAAAAAPAPPLSRKEREQHDANERTRKAVEAATADLRAEVERLKSGAAAAGPVAAAPAPAPAAPAPPAKGEAEWKRYAALPDAPKLEDFETIAEHTAAMAHFIASTMFTDRDAAADRQRATATRDQALKTQSDRYKEHLVSAQTADPEFTKKVAPEILQAVPSSALYQDDGTLVPGARRTLANDIAQVGFDQPEHAPALYQYLTANRAEADRIARLAPPQWIPALLVLVGRLSAGAQPGGTAAPAPAARAAAPAKHLTDAPAPHASRATRAAEAADPKDAAIRTQDTRAYRVIRRAERAAQMGR